MKVITNDIQASREVVCVDDHTIVKLSMLPLAVGQYYRVDDMQVIVHAATPNYEAGQMRGLTAAQFLSVRDTLTEVKDVSRHPLLEARIEIDVGIGLVSSVGVFNKSEPLFTRALSNIADGNVALYVMAGNFSLIHVQVDFLYSIVALTDSERIEIMNRRECATPCTSPIDILLAP